MANYLERVASSAARRAAVAKPPVSGPPVLPPAGRDFFAADPFAIDEEQFVEALETPEISSESKEESENAATQNETLGVPVELKSKVRPAQERLSSEMPFTVQVPRTLRPGATPKVPPPIAQAEPPREQTPPRAAVTVGPEEVTVEPAPVVDQVQSSVKEPIIAEAETTTPLTPRPKPPVANREEQRRAPLPVHTATAPPDTTPIPRVDRMDAPAKYSAEPSPPPALPPVPLPFSRASRIDRPAPDS